MTERTNNTVEPSNNEIELMKESPVFFFLTTDEMNKLLSVVDVNLTQDAETRRLVAQYKNELKQHKL